MAKGLVVILSGVSSIGKDQVRQKLLDDPELGLMDIISPVSYTHLDVYKRQDNTPSGSAFFCGPEQFEFDCRSL